MVCMGCRPGEALAIRWQDVDLVAGAIKITGTTMDDGTRQDSTKTSKKKGATERKVTRARRRSMDPADAEAKPRPILECLVARLLELQVNAKPGVEMVCPSRAGTYLEVGNFGGRWNRAMAGTPWEGVERQALRSTIATHVAEQLGVEITQWLLDHRKLTTTQTANVASAQVGPDVSVGTKGLARRELRAESDE